MYDVGFGATSDRIVSAGDDGTARIWDATRAQTFVGPAVTDDISFNGNGRLIATGSEDGIVRIWDAATGRLRKSQAIPGADSDYLPARFSPSSDEVVIASTAGSRVLDWPISAQRSRLIAQLPKDAGAIVTRFDSTGHRVIYGDATGRLVIDDMRSGREIRLGGAPKNIYDVRVRPDGKYAAAGGESGQIMVWRLDRPAKPVHVITGHRGHVNAIDYSADGRVLSAGADRTARIWNPRGGPDVVLRGHTDELTSATFTSDGNRVLTSSSDGTVRLWDARNGDELMVLQSGAGEIYDSIQSRDGKIATLGKGEVVKVFPCEACGSMDQVRAIAASDKPRELTPQEKQRYLAAAR
jgi:WD40 repeat protein